MAFMIYLLKAEPLPNGAFEAMILDCVSPKPAESMVHPSLPGHYFLYGCHPCTTFSFTSNDKGAPLKQYANYTVTEVSREDFINEITTNATIKALIDMTPHEMNEREKQDKICDPTNCIYTFMPRPFRVRRLPTWAGTDIRGHQIIAIPVNQPMFVKADETEYQPHGFELDYDLLQNVHPELPLRDKTTGRLLVPEGHILFFNLLNDEDETREYFDSQKAARFNDDTDISAQVEDLGSDIIRTSRYRNPATYCSGVSSSPTYLSYSSAFSTVQGSLIDYPFKFTNPDTVKIRYEFLIMFEKLPPSKQALLLIISYHHDYVKHRPLMLSFYRYIMLYFTIPDETLFHVLKFMCFATLNGCPEYTVINNILTMRPHLRTMKRPVRLPPLVDSIANNEAINNEYPKYELDAHGPVLPLTLDTIVVLANNFELQISCFNYGVDQGLEFPTPLDTMLRYSKSYRCICAILEEHPDYLQLNPAARPLWSLAHNNLVNKDDWIDSDLWLDFEQPLLLKLSSLPGFNTGIPHMPTIEDLCIIHERYSLLTWCNKTADITIQRREPHCAGFPECCSAMELIIGTEGILDRQTVRDYQLHNPHAQHVCDASLVKIITFYPHKCYLMSEMRFKNSSWPIYIHGTMLPFVALMFNSHLEDLASMLKVPGLPPVDKMVIDMKLWYDWCSKIYELEKPVFDRGSLLDVYLWIGRVDLIKHLLTTYGTDWITKQTETIIGRRNAAIRSLVADLRKFMGRGGKSSSKSKKMKKKPVKKKQTQDTIEQAPSPLPNPDKVADTQTLDISNVIESITPVQQEMSLEQYERTVGKFKYSRKMIIGRGSNGTLVYKGVWCDKVPVAIKQMNKGFNTLIDKEVEILIQLTSMSSATDNLVRFFGMEETEDYIFLATSLCEMSLQELVEAHKDRYQSLNKQTLIKDIVNGVRFLHNNNIIHNDLNPRNILFKDNHLFITDMGLSKMSVETSFAFTHAPSGQGGYFPAEVINNQRKTNSVDIFSLGCLMYYILTDGGHPFGDIIHRRVTKIVDNQYDLDHLTDVYAADLITQMISHDPSTRPTISTLINHPFFWDINKRQSFIIRVSQSIQNQPHTFLNTTTDKQRFLRQSWNMSIDSKLLDQLNQETQYNFNNVKDLVRCIRNTTLHHHQLFTDSSKTSTFFTSQQSAFQYFEQRHPSLVLHLYQRLRTSTTDVQSDNLKEFFV
ncbi:hypothetical protein SAMD00019534_033540 [Acytostelium subglobosum LB1]|uniref:hypothetical protein n=1 Tax=Acytostelium subglobosum LB1 TaxID=1410327 RepID=UPI000644EC6E|nr:hypothetical protein SAMD00019534_033540 [Acytostelium subglobosum LB1]GAM20179.1 hypothetical protein SAMD00019534_033540 [Acytostelium subglobosum LB1]|eukprot:XP_012759700.1 hypothetical protein SAMD00019534_033540 [Acytostelium subglobosum LB1]